TFARLPVGAAAVDVCVGISWITPYYLGAACDGNLGTATVAILTNVCRGRRCAQQEKQNRRQFSPHIPLHAEVTELISSETRLGTTASMFCFRACITAIPRPMTVSKTNRLHTCALSSGAFVCDMRTNKELGHDATHPGRSVAGFSQNGNGIRGA